MTQDILNNFLGLLFSFFIFEVLFGLKKQPFSSS